MQKPTTTCPACKKDIPLERQFGDTVICDCGWSQQFSHKKKHASKLNANSMTLIAFALLIILSLVHITHWDTYSLKIIPLKAKQSLGLAKLDELKEIASICIKRKKIECTIKAKEASYKQESDLNLLLELGEHYSQLGREQEAQSTYRRYFEQGGDSLDAHYEYARLLDQFGEIYKATKHYKTLLTSSTPLSKKAKYTRAYVRMLIEHRKWALAKRAIYTYRKASQSGYFFMEDELLIINKSI